jgi:hypothetical protein
MEENLEMRLAAAFKTVKTTDNPSEDAIKEYQKAFLLSQAVKNGHHPSSFSQDPRYIEQYLKEYCDLFYTDPEEFVEKYYYILDAKREFENNQKKQIVASRIIETTVLDDDTEEWLVLEVLKDGTYEFWHIPQSEDKCRRKATTEEVMEAIVNLLLYING